MMRCDHRTRVRGGLALLLMGAAAGCAHRTEAPGPGESLGRVPALGGATVLVYPFQIRQGIPSGLMADEELADALRARGSAVRWIFPAEIEAALARSPGVRARTHDLPVSVFLEAEVRRIGDPLFGELRRTATLFGAEVALLPVELRYGEEGAYRVAAALVDVRSGRVYWFGVVQGKPGAPDAPGALATVAEALARVLVPARSGGTGGTLREWGLDGTARRRGRGVEEAGVEGTGRVETRADRME